MVRKFDSKTHDALRTAQEVGIRTSRHPDRAITIWAVVAGGDAFIRSVRGAKAQWYIAAATDGRATLDLGDRQIPYASCPSRIPRRSPQSARRIAPNTRQAPTRRRWFAPKSCRQHCGLNRSDHGVTEFAYRIAATDGAARAGVLHTAHGDVRDARLHAGRHGRHGQGDDRRTRCAPPAPTSCSATPTT